ncbi:NADH-quinone oxidoreductase subunit N [Haloferula luteola]|uniref:NADH-quinone oxidoreductase subunit N n=1 Tax=Haloferula luteola TaxID=595692 RepID=A0A840V2F1_9BACT|nr:NADH-quinone oxidoreductase subunit N [Haloferula luteola]MBB5349844.1 NADH-quinone oxidoreductase subunit N [Haloferula luteola]
MPAYYLEALTVTLGIVLLMLEAFGPAHSKRHIGLIAACGLGLIFIFNLFAIGPDQARPDSAWAGWPLWNLYGYDGIARFYKGFALACTALVILMALDYRPILARFTDHPGSEAATGEYYALPVFACAGMMWMASAKDLASAFVALELVTITFYILVAFLRRNLGSLEAGVKYLILGALSTGFLVYGIAWIYGSTGTMNLQALGLKLATATEASPALLLGVGLVLVSLAFKIGAVPMHVWIPDVYQGAPTPTTAFLSVGSKAAGFVLLLRFLDPLLQVGSPVAKHVMVMLAILAGATLLVGNLAAIAQTNFKRLLAYSSISHAGFLTLALASWQTSSATAMGSVTTVSFYLATYLLMTLAAFFILAQVRLQSGSEEIDAFNGLGKRSPMLAHALTVIMAAMAGVPLTAGFWGKWFVFSLAVNQGLWWCVALATIGAAAGFYYYFKLIRAMWWVEASADAPVVQLPGISRVVVITLTLAILILGVFPAPILWLIG